jgi:hypothetical protein
MGICNFAPNKRGHLHLVLGTLVVVLGTLVLSPLTHHASHLGLTPTYLP